MTRKRKSKGTKLTEQQRIQRLHKNEIRSIFQTVGFARIATASDKEFTFDGSTSDFDDIFLIKNIIVLVEYTVAQQSSISSHLKPKVILYNKILKDTTTFVSFAKERGLIDTKYVDGIYDDHHFNVLIAYCSYNKISSDIRSIDPNIVFIDRSVVQYFRILTKSLKISALYEMLAFLGIAYDKFGECILKSSISGRQSFLGSVLPESHSNFPKGYKIVSFYIDPASLLSRAYVLRRDGWSDRKGLYQRMISRRKIESVRRYLLEYERVFVNNIILTLPSNTKLLDNDHNTVDPSTIKRTQPATISIPNEFNSVGIIDGQHRIFSYYEGGSNEKKIAELRKKQNLLATGIVYPLNVADDEKITFEASLFLDINANQTNTNPDLKQSINQLVHPFTMESIARSVLEDLNESGPLAEKFAYSQFEMSGMKTTSVVSYGLGPLVRPTDNGPIFRRWTDSAKDTFVDKRDYEARTRYVRHCSAQVNIFLSAAKSKLPSERWTVDRTVKNRLLTPTVINGLIGALRHFIENDGVVTFPELQNAFDGLCNFNFEAYRSSQYTVMSSKIYNEFLSLI